MALKFNRRLKTKIILDMAPMIDIIFQLIIFFMLATQVKITTGMEFELPQAKNVSKISDTPLKVTLISTKEIVVGNIRTSISDFPKIIANHTVGDEEQRSIILYGNKSVPYEMLISVMDILKENGYDSIDLALNQKGTL